MCDPRRTGPQERLMPKYEYACKSCGEHIEVVQTFADDPLTECPACGGPLRKVFSPPSIAFKGSGFYRTDNRKRRTEPSSDTKTDASTESKPAAKDGKDGKAEGGKADGGKADGGKADGAKAEPAKKDTAPAADSKPKAAEAKTA
jgi:putative FmdB family regulatory protein